METVVHNTGWIDMTKEEEIIALVKERTSEDSVIPDTDIFDELGCGGDDFHELIEDYG